MFISNPITIAVVSGLGLRGWSPSKAQTTSNVLDTADRVRRSDLRIGTISNYSRSTPSSL